MARYIDTDLLIKNIVKIEDLRTLSTKTIGEAISNTPTAEVEEVRHGEWKHSMEVGQIYNHHYWNCSLCGVSAFTSGYEKYCHECGAKMDGGKAE